MDEHPGIFLKWGNHEIQFELLNNYFIQDVQLQAEALMCRPI